MGRAGFLLVDKPQGWTSHDVVAKVRNTARLRKVGHAGTLDPMATGLLVLGLGRATRLLRYVQDLPKVYVATALFGVATDSLDADGSVLSREPMPVDEATVAAAMKRFVGSIHQIPPMVSARKVEGRRLYELAREGKEIERDARPVEIYRLDLLDFAPSDYPEVTFEVVCSKGTYVRTLADDVARALGGRAHLTALRRISNGSLDVAAAHSVDAIVDAAASGKIADLVLPPADALVDLPAVSVDDDLAQGVKNGVALTSGALEFPDLSPFRVLHDGQLLAVYATTGQKATAEVVMG